MGNGCALASIWLIAMFVLCCCCCCCKVIELVPVETMVDEGALGMVNLIPPAVAAPGEDLTGDVFANTAEGTTKAVAGTLARDVLAAVVVGVTTPFTSSLFVVVLVSASCRMEEVLIGEAAVVTILVVIDCCCCVVCCCTVLTFGGGDRYGSSELSMLMRFSSVEGSSLSSASMMSPLVVSPEEISSDCFTGC